MSKATRILLAVLIGGALLMVATVGMAAATVYRAGTIRVAVHEERGAQFDLSLPAGLAHVAIAFAPDDLLEEALVEVEPLVPAVRAGWKGLRDAPDFVLCRVESAREQIRVEKRGDRLIVLVDADDANVRISVPLGTVDSLLAKLDGRGGWLG